jgi:hypothetical protein
MLNSPIICFSTPSKSILKSTTFPVLHPHSRFGRLFIHLDRQIVIATIPTDFGIIGVVQWKDRRLAIGTA